MNKKIQSKLNALAKEQGLDPNRVKALFALERIVARLESVPELARSLVFKGGFVLIRTTNTDRITKDVDAAIFDIGKEAAQNLLVRAIESSLDDNIRFYDVRVSAIMVTDDYAGLRADCAFSIDPEEINQNKIKKLPRVHLDVGFGEYIPPNTERLPLEPMIDEERFKVSWRIYPLEYIFSEKLETTLSRGTANSRAKDLYDMWFIVKSGLKRSALDIAIKHVFEARSAELPKDLATELKNLNLQFLEQSFGSIEISGECPSLSDMREEIVQFFQDVES